MTPLTDKYFLINEQKHYYVLLQSSIDGEVIWGNKQEMLEKVSENHVNINVAKNAPKLMYKEHFIAGAKWQQERSYSEEEVLTLLLNRPGPYLTDNEIKEWFEQFKKK